MKKQTKYTKRIGLWTAIILFFIVIFFNLIRYKSYGIDGNYVSQDGNTTMTISGTHFSYTDTNKNVYLDGLLDYDEELSNDSLSIFYFTNKGNNSYTLRCYKEEDGYLIKITEAIYLSSSITLTKV